MRVSDLVLFRTIRIQSRVSSSEKLLKTRKTFFQSQNDESQLIIKPSPQQEVPPLSYCYLIVKVIFVLSLTAAGHGAPGSGSGSGWVNIPAALIFLFVGSRVRSRLLIDRRSIADLHPHTQTAAEPQPVLSGLAADGQSPPPPLAHWFSCLPVASESRYSIRCSLSAVAAAPLPP